VGVGIHLSGYATYRELVTARRIVTDTLTGRRIALAHIQSL